MTVLDSFRLAYGTLKGNKLRTGITVAIIALGIWALIGILTAIAAMNQKMKESFSSMGANSFSIRYKESNVRFGGGRTVTMTQRGKKEKKSNLDKFIRREDAEYFKANYHFPAKVSIYLRGPGNQECVFEDKKTNPVVTVWGGDENYLEVNGFSVDGGRNLNNLDVQSGRSVCLVGSNVVTHLFGSHPEKCIDQIIRVGGMPYRIIGFLKPKGSSGLLRQDDIIVTSYNNSRRLPNGATSYLLGIEVENVADLDGAMDEATSVFRAVRKLQPMDADNFALEKSDKFAQLFISFLSSITGAAGAIGMITLIGAAICLMNIMLVAVNERTREVGLIKAIGGKKSNVRRQFLFESLIISLLGAFFGILVGVLSGNALALFMGTGFVVPWFWIIMGVVICSIVGLAAGIYPAMKAARLNPIDALRYE